MKAKILTFGIVVITCTICYAQGGSFAKKGEYQNFAPLYVEPLRIDVDRVNRQAERREEQERNKAQFEIEQIKEIYNNRKSTYLDALPSGEYIVSLTNNYDFCDRVKVHVFDNKVIKLEAIVDGEMINVKVDISSSIYKNFCFIELNNKSLYIYFIY